MTVDDAHIIRRRGKYFVHDSSHISSNDKEGNKNLNSYLPPCNVFWWQYGGAA